MRRTLVIGVVALAALTAAPAAYAHDNTITAQPSTCNPDGSWTANYTITNDNKLGETVTLVFDSGAATQVFGLGGLASFAAVTPGTQPAITATATGVWTDGFTRAGHSATAYAPEQECVPVGPPPPVDVCPNLPGVQLHPPVGYVIDSIGRCVPATPPPPPPPPPPHHHHAHHHQAHGIGEPQTISVAAHELPHTGAPVWMLVLAGLGMAGVGVVLRRRLP